MALATTIDDLIVAKATPTENEIKYAQTPRGIRKIRLSMLSDRVFLKIN